MEQQRQEAEGPSEVERLRMAAADAVRGKAAAAKLEATDEAKRMNQMVLYSKCMAVRCAAASKPVRDRTYWQTSIFNGCPLVAELQLQLVCSKRVAEEQMILRSNHMAGRCAAASKCLSLCLQFLVKQALVWGFTPCDRGPGDCRSRSRVSQKQQCHV